MRINNIHTKICVKTHNGVRYIHLDIYARSYHDGGLYDAKLWRLVSERVDQNLTTIRGISTQYITCMIVYSIGMQ